MAGEQGVGRLGVGRLGTFRLGVGGSLLPKVLVSAANDVDATSFTTASISPTQGMLQLALVISGSATPTPLPSLSGCGLTWVRIGAITMGSSGGRRVTVFRAMKLSGVTSGPLTVSFDGTTVIQGCSWIVMEMAADQSGTDGSGAVQQIVSATGTATGLTATLGAFANSRNPTIVLAGIKSSPLTVTGGGGFATLSQTTNSAPLMTGFAGYNPANDTTADATWGSTALDAGVFGLEINIATAGVDGTASAPVTNATASRYTPDYSSSSTPVEASLPNATANRLTPVISGSVNATVTQVSRPNAAAATLTPVVFGTAAGVVAEGSPPVATAAPRTPLVNASAVIVVPRSDVAAATLRLAIHSPLVTAQIVMSGRGSLAVNGKITGGGDSVVAMVPAPPLSIPTMLMMALPGVHAPSHKRHVLGGAIKSSSPLVMSGRGSMRVRAEVVKRTSALEHVFSGHGAGRTLPVLNGASSSLFGGFTDQLSIAGGCISANGQVTQREYDAMGGDDGLYQIGTNYLVRDNKSGVFMFGGILRDGETSGGLAEIVVDGWGKLSDRIVDRFLLQSQSLDGWMTGASTNVIKYPDDDRIVAGISGEKLRFAVAAGTAFKRNKDGLPAAWQTGVYFWTPLTKLRRVAFDIHRSGESSDYTIQVVAAVGPAGTLQVIAESPSLNASPYRDSVMSDAPAGYWRLGQPAGRNNLGDSSGHGHDATRNDGSLGKTGAIQEDADTCIYFNGGQQWNAVSVPDHADFHLGQQAVEAWIKKDSSRDEVLMGRWNVGSNNRSWAVGVRANGAVFVATSTNGTASVVEDTAGKYVTKGQWVHLAVVFGAAGRLVYINGALVETLNSGGSTPWTGANTAFVIGDVSNQALSVDPFTGWVDEVAIYPTTLSSARFMDHYMKATDHDSVAIKMDVLIPKDTYDLVGIRCRRVVGVEKAPGRTFTLENVRVSAIAETDTYTVHDAFVELFNRMGCTTTNVAASTVTALPYDAINAGLGQIADEIALLDSWYWRIVPGPNGERQGEAGPFGTRKWHLKRTQFPVRLLPQDRYNKVRYQYALAAQGVTAEDVVTANGAWESDEDMVYALELDTPGQKGVMQALAQKVADYLVLRRTSGTTDFTEVVDDNGTVFPSLVVFPGDQLILDNYGGKTITVQELTHAADGSFSEAQLAEGNPLLDIWLARRQQFLNRGLPPAAATENVIDSDRPSVPENVRMGFKKVVLEDNKIAYNAVVDWDAVVEDIQGQGTSIERYHARIRPCDVDGNPIDPGFGGGWREQVAQIPHEDDPSQQDPGAEPPTELVWENVQNPTKWYWQASVAAEDFIGQMSDWSDPTDSTKPSSFPPGPPTFLRLYVSQSAQYAEWQPPNDADQNPPAFYDVYLTKNGDRVADHDRIVYGLATTFLAQRPDVPKGSQWLLHVRAEDSYGNKGPWNVLSDPESVGEPPQPKASINKLLLNNGKLDLQVTFEYDWTVYTEDNIAHYIVQLQRSDNAVWDDHDVIGDGRPVQEGDDKSITFADVMRDHYFRSRVTAVSASGRRSDPSPWSVPIRARVGAQQQNTTEPGNAKSTAMVKSVAIEWSPAYTNETQSIIQDAGGGTFRLVFTTPGGARVDGTPFTTPAGTVQTTAAIPFDATEGQIQSVLEALSNIDPGDVLVTGYMPGIMSVEFQGQYAGVDVPDMTGLNSLTSYTTFEVAGHNDQPVFASYYGVQAWKDGFDSGTLMVDTRTASSRYTVATEDPDPVYMRVRAVSPQGEMSDWVPTPPVAPLDISGTNGLPPTASPVPTVTPLMGGLHVRWTQLDPVLNPDAVTYEVHVSLTSGFVASSATKIAETTGGSWDIFQMPDGSILVPNTLYYVRVWAKDEDGYAASASVQGSGVSFTGGGGDGRPPAKIGFVSIIGGPGYIAVRWPLVALNDQGGPQTEHVKYSVYMSTTSGFTPGPATLVGETQGGIMFIVHDASDSDLLYDTTYYVRVAGTDGDGQGVASDEQGNQLVRITTVDIEDDSITAPQIAANSIIAGKIAAGAIVAGDAVIANGAITSALIQDLAVTNAKIADLSVDKLTAGVLNALVVLASEVTLGGSGSGSAGLLKVENEIDALTVEVGTLDHPDTGDTSYGMRLWDEQGEPAAEFSTSGFRYGDLFVGTLESPSVVGVNMEDMQLYVDYVNGDSSSDGRMPVLLVDTFQRGAQSGWGFSDSGHSWENHGGSLADYNVPGDGTGRITCPSGGVRVERSLGAGGFFDEIVMDFAVSRLPTANSFFVGAAFRCLDDNTLYAVRVEVAVGGSLNVGLRKRVGGTSTAVVTEIASGIVATASKMYRLRARLWGSGYNGDPISAQGKVWDPTGPEPAAWTMDAPDIDNDSTLAPGGGSVGVYVVGNAYSGATIVASFDNIIHNVLNTDGDVITDAVGPLSTISDALDAIPQYNSGIINIVVVGGGVDQYEDVQLDSYSGAGALVIDGSGQLNLVGSFDLNGNTQWISLQHFSMVDSGGGNDSSTINVNWSRHVEVNDVQIQTDKTNTGKSFNVRYQQGSSGTVKNCQLNGADDCVRSSEGSMVFCSNNKGTGASNAYFSTAAELYVGGSTEPVGGNGTGSSGHVSGSATPTSGTSHVGTGRTTRSYRAVKSASYQGAPTYYGWRSGDSVYQGNYGYGNHKGIWVIPAALASALSGKTVRSMSITIRRGNQGGASQAMPLYLFTTNGDGTGGEPNVISGPTRIGSLAWGQTRKFAVPTNLWADIKAGRNVGLYVGSGNPYLICVGANEFADSGRIWVTYS